LTFQYREDLESVRPFIELYAAALPAAGRYGIGGKARRFN